MKSLLAHSLEEDNSLSKNGAVTLDDKKYKINVNDSKTNLEYTIEFLKLDEDTTVVDFKKIAGNAFEFNEKISNVKKVIESL